jgi:tRNA A58 N-methylase Trm61
MVAVTVTPGEVFHNKFGRYPHEEFIGQKFGSKVRTVPYSFVLQADIAAGGYRPAF